jgi:hypothetical protein
VGERVGPALVGAMNIQCFNPQFFIGFRVGDVALKDDWEHRARGYDHRLGVVIDALRVLSAAIRAEVLMPDDQVVLDRLNSLEANADRGLTPGGSGDASLTRAGVDDLIHKLRQLRRADPVSADQIVRRIVEEAGPPAPAVTS